MGAAAAACAYLWMNFLCVPTPYAHSVQENGMVVGDIRTDTESKITGVRIELFDTDQLLSAPDTAFEHACVRSGCVLYRKHCKSPMSCEFTVPEPWVVSFTVIAASPERMRRALQRITYLANGVEVPLALLTAETPAEIKIGCPRLVPPRARYLVTKQLQGCPAL
jgi:hypothetical protein